MVDIRITLEKSRLNITPGDYFSKETVRIIPDVNNCQYSFRIYPNGKIEIVKWIGREEHIIYEELPNE